MSLPPPTPAYLYRNSLSSKQEIRRQEQREILKGKELIFILKSTVTFVPENNRILKGTFAEATYVVVFYLL